MRCIILGSISNIFSRLYHSTNKPWAFFIEATECLWIYGMLSEHPMSLYSPLLKLQTWGGIKRRLPGKGVKYTQINVTTIAEYENEFAETLLLFSGRIRHTMVPWFMIDSTRIPKYPSLPPRNGKQMNQQPNMHEESLKTDDLHRETWW